MGEKNQQKGWGDTLKVDTSRKPSIGSGSFEFPFLSALLVVFFGRRHEKSLNHLSGAVEAKNWSVRPN